MSHVRDVAAIVLPRMCDGGYGYLVNVGRQGIRCLLAVKMVWESPPSILVTRNPNWSQRLGTGTGCVKGRY